MLLKLGDHDPAGSERKESSRQQRGHPNHVLIRKRRMTGGVVNHGDYKDFTETYCQRGVG